MAAERLTDLPRATDANGSPLSGALFYFYATGTTTPQSVYTTSALSVAHANPVVADSGGSFAPIYFDASVAYRGVLKTAAGETLRDIDPINEGAFIALAASGGSALVGFIQSGTGAVARTTEARLRDLPVSIVDFGAVADWNGTTGTDNTAAIQAALDTGARNVYVPEGKYKFTTGLTLRAGQQLVGDTSALITYTATQPQSTLAFRPATGSKVALKNAANTNGQGVRGITLDLNDSTNYGMQFSTTYGITIEDVTFWGTFDIGMLFEDCYVMDINRVVMNGCTVKRAGILVGTYNGLTIRNFHTSMLPYEVGTCMRGIAIYGGGSVTRIDTAYLQGPTIGLDVRTAQSVHAVGIYTENTVCPVKLGDAAGSADAVTLQGLFAGPEASHIHYASRGPIIYARAATAVDILPSYFAGTPAAGTATGPWSILCGGGAGRIRIAPQSIFGSTVDRDLVMREAAGDTPSIDMTSAYGSYGARELLMKKDGAYGGTHYGIRIDTAGAITTSAWAPTAVTGTVAALLTGTIPQPSANLL